MATPLSHERFEIGRRLGHGGMGVVYEALDRATGATVALKTLRDVDPLALMHFKREFRALADLEHPNLVRLGELFAHQGSWFFTMELVSGVDFLSWVSRREPAPGPRARPLDATDPGVPGHVARPPLDVERLTSALRQLGEGLAALHATGRVHRDVKPSNVLVTPAGRVVLLDFGLVTDPNATSDSGHTIVGTAAYMAPEQAASQRVGPEADWYAVGVMLHEALVGRAPFVGPPLGVLMDKQRREPPAPRALDGGIPEELSELCAQLLRRRPEERLAGTRALERLGARPPRSAAEEEEAQASQTRAATFVGRAAELECMRAAWSEARGAKPRAALVVVRGESGIGKSALASRFLAELADAPSQPLILRARCYEREAVPFKAFDGLVEGLARYLARLEPERAAALVPADAASVARLFPVLRRVPAVAAAPDVRVLAPQELRARAFAGLAELLGRLAELRPTLLSIDDFQWADADSLALLGALLAGLRPPPLVVLVTTRPASGPTAEALDGLAVERTSIELGALTADEAEKLAGALLGDDAPEPARAERTVRRVAHESGGHPLFLHELARHVAGGHTGRGLRLEDALWERVRGLEPAALGLLEVLAVAGEPLAAPIVGEAAGVDPGEAQRQLAVLRAGYLVRRAGRGELGGAFAAAERLECYHDRVREAVTSRLPGERVRAVHAALAAVLEAGGAAGWAPLALVRHLEAAGEPRRAAEQAELAARRAAETLAFDRAAELYRSALRLGAPRGAGRGQLLMALAQAQAHGGHVVDAARTYLEAADGADGATRLGCLARAAEYLIGTGHFEEGERALADVVGELGEALPATPRRAVLSALWNRLRTRLRGLGVRVREAGELPARELLRIDAYRAMATGLGMIDTARAVDFTSRGTLRALVAGEPERLVRALAADAAAHGSTGVAGRRRAAQLIETADRVRAGRDPALGAWVLASRGILAYLAGDLGQALATLPLAEAQFRDEIVPRASWELATVRVFQALALRYAGRLPALRALHDAHVADALRRGDRYVEATMRRLATLVHLGDDDPDAALRELDRSAWTPPAGAYHMQSWYEWRARAEVVLYRGEPALLEVQAAATHAALHRSLLWRVQNVRMEFLWLAGRLALAHAAAGTLSGPEDLTTAARQAGKLARALRRERHPFAPVWADLLAAGAARGLGRRDEAALCLGRAADTARNLGLEACAAVAELILGAAPASATAALVELGVKAPARFAAMLVPAPEPLRG